MCGNRSVNLQTKVDFFFAVFSAYFDVFFVFCGMETNAAVNTVSGGTMKRFIVILVLVAVLTAALAYKMPVDFADFAAAYFGDGQVNIYCRNTVLPSTDIGVGRIVQCSASRLRQTLASCEDVDGVSVCFNGTLFDAERVTDLFALGDISVSEFDDLTVICGYSALLRGGVMLDGRRVNLQIAYRDGIVTVGSPLILGSY